MSDSYKLTIMKDGQWREVGCFGNGSTPTPTPTKESKNFVHYVKNNVSASAENKYTIKTGEACSFFAVGGGDKAVDTKGIRLKRSEILNTKLGNHGHHVCLQESHKLSANTEYNLSYLLNNLVSEDWVELDIQFTKWVNNGESGYWDLRYACFPDELNKEENTKNSDFFIADLSVEDFEVFGLKECLRIFDCFYHIGSHGAGKIYDGKKHLPADLTNWCGISNQKFVIRFVKDYREIQLSEFPHAASMWDGNMSDFYLDVTLAVVRDNKYLFNDADTAVHVIARVRPKRFIK